MKNNETTDKINTELFNRRKGNGVNDASLLAKDEKVKNYL